MLNLLKEFCKRSSMHGLELVMSEKKSVKERVFWGCLVGIATILLAQNLYRLGMRVTNSNVELIVDNPNYSLENTDYPAVTLCVNSKVMRSRLSQHVRMNRKYRFSQPDLESFTNTVLALDLMRYPFLHHPSLFVERHNLSVYPIPNDEIFDLMMAVRPMLSDMITGCRWRGRTFKCKQLFRKQVTEEGFCYSFNSRTAERSLDDLPRLPPEERPDGTLECLRNNAAGRDSGLSFNLKSLDTEIYERSLQTRGFSVMIHSPNSYPQISHKYLVFWKNYTFSRLNVRVVTMRADQSISRIPPTARGCTMARADPYVCMMKCRQREILKQCGCLPYYMYHFNRYAETCGVQHFKCLKENNKRFNNVRVVGEHFKIPEWSQPMSMNCTCEMPCSSTSYITEYSVIPAEEVTGQINNKGSVLGLVEVVYKTNYATSYIKRARFTFSDFLVDVGSLAGLFLGCSIITMVELCVFLYKMATETFHRVAVRHTAIHPYIE